MSKTFCFDTSKGKKTQTYYVIAKNFKAAATKFYTKYPNAQVSSVWQARRENIPVVIK